MFNSKDEYYDALRSRAHLPSGFRAGTTALSFFPQERPADTPYRMNLSLIRMDAPAGIAAGVFTRNVFPGAPVVVCRRRLSSGSPAGVLINNRIANVCAPGGEETAEEILTELE
ncbi:MAG: bifunctional ornithine acetyltransferase/N-acetylglutamate synthase, partial [Spirochaetales bacterium]|nr:bifunctional ornithine acetyltransferase/N-acetylglutamate synthase [Spirochaetales bacterium]